jgi:tRNA 2-selenouridine synthase
LNLPQTTDFKRLLLTDTPLIDVRAPIEFEKGAFPASVNLPLMDNEEREAVGICYKEQGSRKALELGYSLVKGEIKEKRVKSWCDFIDAHPDAVLYCFRGGDRSRISQEWLHEAGYDIPRIKGGYKAFRRFILEALENVGSRFTPIVLGGTTGSGKTILLKKIKESIDLEGLAKHRGSAFGRQIEPQPTQINFEHELAASLLKKIKAGMREIVVEDESRKIGQREIPQALFSRFKEAPLVILDVPMAQRVETILEEYVSGFQQQFAERFGKKEGLQAWEETMHRSFNGIKRKLGGLRHAELVSLFEDALEVQESKNDLQAHKVWIEALLREYYDPMYEYQIEQSRERIVFRGNESEILAYLKQRMEK